MKKKKIWIPLAAFFIVMVVTTAVSENLYFDSLPTVTAGTPKKGTLSESYRSQGNIRYGKLSKSLCARFDFQEVTLIAGDGGRVAKDDPLYSVSAEEVLMLQKQAEMAILELHEQNVRISPDGSLSGLSERETLQYEMNELQTADWERKVGELKTLYENGGIVTAGTDGTIAYRIQSGEAVQKGQSIASLSADTDRRYLEWQMPADQGSLFTIGDTAETLLEVVMLDSNGEVITAEQIYEVTVDEIKFLEQTKSYTFQAGIPEMTNLSMADGTSVQVYLRYESHEEYSYIVPASAVIFEQDIAGDTDRGYIYAIDSRKKVYGEEYYVIPFYVEVKQRLGNYAALNSVPNGYQFAFTSTDILSNEMAVKLN